MLSFNQSTLMGNLTRDPEVRYTPKGTPICHFSLAINRKWKDAVGTAMEDTTFIDCTAFGAQAETISEYVKKGDPLFVQGSLRNESWEKEGKKHSKVLVYVDTFQFLKPKAGGGVPSTLRPDPSDS